MEWTALRVNVVILHACAVRCPHKKTPKGPGFFLPRPVPGVPLDPGGDEDANGGALSDDV